MWRNKIILDCDLMKFPNTGLFHYCLNLGNHVNDLLAAEGEELMRFYVPPAQAHCFADRQLVIRENKRHRFIRPFMYGCKLWHAPFQSGRIFPFNNPSVKVLLTIHDLNALHEDLPKAAQDRSVAHTQQLINRSNAIVCISDFCKTDVLKNCDVGNKPIYVIHNGTHAVGQPELQTISYKPVRPFLFAMGDVNRKKNFHTLMPMMASNHFELIIAGRLAEPDYIQQIKTEAEMLGMKDRIHILGPVTEGEKAWYLQNCTAYVHPSLAEGFGAPVVEAMSFGKPLFLSHLTSLPEIGGDVAFYFRSFDPEHMKDILLNGLDQYNKNGMADKIKERGTQFDWRQKAKEYLKVYKTLL
ncbi:MAG TPA: glycosyltransferase family 1 protein [Flavisolibacter sp.]|nr:glycosyltransferase family 1 protein [Flavisolibacter sp.]